MKIERSVVLPGPAPVVFELLDDLGRYPEWMDLVHGVTELPPTPDGRRAWDVELRAQVGPLARSKRLRMVRTVHEPARTVVFERDEIDDRRHSPWVLQSTLAPCAPSRIEVTMTLSYGGNLWTGAVLERVLDDHVERGANALAALLADRSPGVDAD
jgi:Polyketide cyclase / dehydrase and lipid transport